jgi:hypothetical protein
MGEDILNAALRLADDGVPVFPVSTKKTPVWEKGESPNGRDGLHAATTDPDEVEALFAHPRTAGIGMPTGKISRVTVIDVDCGRGKPHRDAAMEWLDGARKSALWGATVVRTGSGGLHYYMRYREGLKTGANVWAMGVDCRNDGGYVVVPPFMGYRYERQTDPDDWPAVPEPPASRVKRTIVDQKDGRCPPEIMAMRDLIEGKVTWHDPVRDIIAHLVGSGWSDAEILRFTFQWTWPGYNPAETFEQICVMLNGAREKWTKSQKPETLTDLRLDRFVMLWDRCSTAEKLEIIKMIKEVAPE